MRANAKRGNTLILFVISINNFSMVCICKNFSNSITYKREGFVMSEKPVARVGDTGSHGGSITTGSNSIFVNSKPIARVGDIYNCPEHGPNPK